MESKDSKKESLSKKIEKRYSEIKKDLNKKWNSDYNFNLAKSAKGGLVLGGLLGTGLGLFNGDLLPYISDVDLYQQIGGPIEGAVLGAGIGAAAPFITRAGNNFYDYMQKNSAKSALKESTTKYLNESALTKILAGTGAVLGAVHGLHGLSDTINNSGTLDPQETMNNMQSALDKIGSGVKDSLIGAGVGTAVGIGINAINNSKTLNKKWDR